MPLSHLLFPNLGPGLLIVRSEFISETPAANEFGEVCFPAPVIEEGTRPLEEGERDENGVNPSGLASFYQDSNI